MVIDRTELIEAIANRLDRVHFDGKGCGTHGDTACSTCHGPSPMSALEVATEVVALIESLDTSLGT